MHDLRCVWCAKLWWPRQGKVWLVQRWRPFHWEFTLGMKRLGKIVNKCQRSWYWAHLMAYDKFYLMALIIINRPRYFGRDIKVQSIYLACCTTSAHECYILYKLVQIDKKDFCFNTWNIGILKYKVSIVANSGNLPFVHFIPDTAVCRAVCFTHISNCHRALVGRWKTNTVNKWNPTDSCLTPVFSTFSGGQGKHHLKPSLKMGKCKFGRVENLLSSQLGRRSSAEICRQAGNLDAVVKCNRIEEYLWVYAVYQLLWVVDLSVFKYLLNWTRISLFWRKKT